MQSLLRASIIAVTLGVIGRFIVSGHDNTSALLYKADIKNSASSDRPRTKLHDSLVPPLLLSSPTTNGRELANRFAPQPSSVPLEYLNDGEFTTDARASFHPHGKNFCASGCAVSNHPTGQLTESLFAEQLARFAHEPMDETSEAFESLVFYGRQTRRFLESEGADPLDPDRVEFLRRELARTHALVSIRVVDESGGVRASLPPTRVPFDRRHVFTMDVRGVQPLLTSGTVKRVGLNHIWVRL